MQTMCVNSILSPFSIYVWCQRNRNWIGYSHNKGCGAFFQNGFFCTKLFCDAKLIWLETLENVIGLNWCNIQWSCGKLSFFSSKKSSNFVLKNHNLPWAIITKFKINEGIATGNNSHNTAKWSYLDHPVRTKPLNDTFPELSVSRLITSSHARKEFWMK